MLFLLLPLLATAGGGLLLWKTNVGERVLSLALTKVFSILGEQGNVTSLEDGRGEAPSAAASHPSAVLSHAHVPPRCPGAVPTSPRSSAAKCGAQRA